MKNVLLLLVLILSMSASCGDTPKPLPLPPYNHPMEFILVFEKGSEVAKNILSPGDTINVEEVYFYRMQNGQKKKIKTYSNLISYLENMFFISSYDTFLFDSIIGKGLTKIYLQKRNNAVDTIEIEVEREVEYGDPNKTWQYYVHTMKSVTINGTYPTGFYEFTYWAGYAYYLEPPKSPTSRLPLR